MWRIRRPQCPGILRYAHVVQSQQGHPIVYHPDFKISPLKLGHRFPMPKDHLVYVRLKELGYANATFTPRCPDSETLSLVHSRSYVDSFIAGTISAEKMRRIGLPWSEELLKRTLIGVGSAVLAARLALQYGVAAMCNGGTHHAHADHGSGWCIFNDLAVAARAAQRDAGVKKVLFVDLDVHQGDGTAAIFWNDPSVFTLSVHCDAQSFPAPLHKSSEDVALPAGTSDREYMQVLEEVVPRVLEQFQPELVLYNAGVDVHKDDALGKMSLTDEGILRRDKFVFSACANACVPVACAIGGGYQEDHTRIVERHVLLHRAAREALPALSQVALFRKAQRNSTN
ncbi:g8108 [Coccomyxa elongata]